MAVFFVLGVEPFFLQNGIDPFIYVGYIENQPDLIDRFGYSYFAVRFGLIVPSHVASSLFGPLVGYFVLRYVLAVMVVGAVYLLARRNGSRAAGWFGAVVCLSSPLFLRALMTTYADTTGLPYLLAGFACMLMPSPHRLRWSIGGGVLFALAVHSNPFLVALITVGCGARLVLQLARRDPRVMREYLCAALAAIGVTIVGGLYYWLAFGDANILRPSVEALRTYGGEAGRFFRSPTRDWLRFSLHLYMPLVLLVAMTALLLTRRPVLGAGRLRSFAAAPLADAFILLLAVQVFYLVQQFVFDGYSFEVYYYASFLFAFTVLGATTAMMELATRRPFGERGAWLACGLAVGIPLARNQFFDGLELWVVPVVPLLVAIVALPLLSSRWRPQLLWLGAGALVGALGLLGLAPPRNVPLSPGQTFRYDPNYQLAIGNRNTTGLEWYELAVKLVDVTPKESSDPGSMLFWYRNEPNLLNGVQSTYLWRATTVQAGNPGLPELSELQRQLLRERTPRHIAILAVDPTDLQTGRNALKGIGLQPVGRTDRVLRAGATTVYLELLTFDAATCDWEWHKPVPWLSLSPCP